MKNPAEALEMLATMHLDIRFPHETSVSVAERQTYGFIFTKILVKELHSPGYIEKFMARLRQEGLSSEPGYRTIYSGLAIAAGFDKEEV